MIRMLTVTGLLLSLSLPLLVQDEAAKTDEKTANASRLDALTHDAKAPQNELAIYGVDAFPCDKEAAGSPVFESCLKARQAYYNYYDQGLTRRASAYAWNNFSTRVIFVVVLSLVGIGVYFSWKQFFGMVMKAPVEKVEVSAPDPQSLLTEIELPIVGIKVKSPVLGVILLTISLGFFYLYLKFVYPVTEGF